MCGDCARVLLLYARVVQQLGFWTQKVQTNVVYGYVRRRAEYTSLGPGLEHLSLDVPTRFTLCRFQQSTRAQHGSCCWSVCTLV